MTENKPHQHHKTMKSFFKKVLGGGSRESHNPPPVAPPSPDISHLTAEELRILSDVIKRQEQFDQQEQERVRRLEAEMAAAEQELKGSQPEKRKKWRMASARLCRLCHKTRLSEGAGRTCTDCRKRVCGRCGSYYNTARPSASEKGVWLCRLCNMKREVSCRTGEWYHGSRGNNYQDDNHVTGSAAYVLRRKLRDFAADSTGSDLQTSGNDRGESDREAVPSCHGSDSQLMHGQLPALRSHDPALSSGRRRSLPPGSAPTAPHRRHQDQDDDDDDIDDILLERKLSHRRRQQKRLRRRSVQNGQSGKGAGVNGSKSDLQMNAHLQDDQGLSHKQSGRETDSSPAREDRNQGNELPNTNTMLSPVRDQHESDVAGAEDSRSRPSHNSRSQDKWSAVSQSISLARSKRRAFQQAAMVSRKSAIVAMAGKSSSMSDSDQGSSPRNSYPRSYSADSPRRDSHSGSVTEKRLTPHLSHHAGSLPRSAPHELSGSRVATSVGSHDGERPRRISPSRDDRKVSDDRAPRISPSRDANIVNDSEKLRKISAESRRDVKNACSGERTRGMSPSRDLKNLTDGGRYRRSSPSRNTQNIRDGNVARDGDRTRRSSPSRDTLHTSWADRTKRVSPPHDPKFASPKEKRKNDDDKQRRPSLSGDVSGGRSRHSCVTDDGKSRPDRRSHVNESGQTQKQKDRDYYSDGHICSGDEVDGTPGRTHQSAVSARTSPHTIRSKAPRFRPPRQYSFDERTKPDKPTTISPIYPSSPEKSGGPDPCSSPTPYTCVTQALRNVSSPHEYVTSPDTGHRTSSTCTCATPDTCIAKSCLSGVTECCACALAIERSWEWKKEAWDYDGNLGHTILHKPPNSFPEAFGLRVMGGVGDGNGGLVTIIGTVIHGSPAQLAGVQQGDQLVAWAGQPLTGTSFEQALSVFVNTRCDVIHLLTLPKHLIGRPSSPQSRSCSRHSDLEHPVSPHGHSPVTWGSESTLSMGHISDGSGTGHKRRILPRTPAEIGRDSRKMCGEILLSLDYDPRTTILYVSLLKGRGLGLPKAGSNPDIGVQGPGQVLSSSQKLDQEHTQDSRPSSAGGDPSGGGGTADPNQNAKRARQTLELPHVTVKGAGLSGSEAEDAEHDAPCTAFPSAFAMVHLLPHRKSREAHKTEIRKYSRRPKWEQTFVYDSVTITELVSRCLEVTVWSREDRTDEFLGEILLELREWRNYQHATWCRLHDHDENSSPLPRPRQLLAHDSVASSASSSCYDDLARSHDMQGAHRLSPTTGATQANLGSTKDLQVAPDTITQKLSKVTKGMVRNRNRLVSRVSTSFSHADRKETGSDESSPGDLSRRRSVSETHVNHHDDKLISPSISRHPSYNMDLLAPPRPLSRANSSSSFFLSDDSSDGDPYSPTSLTPDRPAPDGDDITSILGPGQVLPRPASETLVCGDIKVGLAVTKGQLEVDIICVRCLQRSPQAPAPDTYVKTYLVEGRKTIQKKKTQVIKACADPIFRRKIKYSACNVHGRHMRIVVWERPRNFERKQSLGETVIKLDSVDLSLHTTTWYKLFPVNSTDLGSTDSLSQWP